MRPRTGGIHGRVTCRVPVTRRPCTRPVNTSSPAKTTRTRPYNGRAVYAACTRPCMGRAHGPFIPPVYMTVYGPSARTSSAVYMARTRPTRPRTQHMYTAVYGPCTRPCTRHVYGRVHESTCLRVHGRVRATYTAENGRRHGRARPCNVSCIRPCTYPVYGAVYATRTRSKTSVQTARTQSCTRVV